MLRLIRNLYRRLFRVPAPKIGDFVPATYFDFVKGRYYENGVEKPWPEHQFPKAQLTANGFRVIGTIPQSLSDDELRRLTE